MKLKKTLSAILSIITLFTLIPSFSAYAENAPEIKAVELSEKELQNIAEQSVSKLPEELLQKLSLKDSDLPESMRNTDVKDTNAVVRLKAQEDDMSSVLYANSDGTYSEFFFSENVKYKKDGEVFDKSNALTSSLKLGGYTNEQNDINVKLPFMITNNSGIELSYEDYKIEFIPKDTGKLLTTAAQTKEDTVVYKNAFGKGTSLEYIAQFSGIKENILIESDTGVYDYTFTVKTHGLFLKILDDHAVICDSKGDTVAKIGEVIIYDSNGKQGDGSFSVKEIVPAEEYVYKISVSEDYIKSEDTLFPITVDPTISYNTGVYIYDSTITEVSSFGTISYDLNYTSAFISLGYTGQSGSIEFTGRALMNFAGAVNRVNTLSSADHLLNADVTINNTPYVTSQTKVDCYRMNTSWGIDSISANATIWNGYVSNTVQTKSFTANVHTVIFDLTNHFKYWYNNTNYGIMLKLQQESGYCRIASKENSTTSLRPVIRLVYIPRTTAESGIKDKSIYRIKSYNGISYPNLRCARTNNSSYSLQITNSNPTTGSTLNYSYYFSFKSTNDNGSFKISPTNANYRGSKKLWNTTTEYMIYTNGSTISLSSSYNNSDKTSWYPLQTASGNFYLINKYYLNCFLGVNYSETGTAVYSTQTESALWSLDFVGLDVPLVQQLPDYCGPCSTLQMIEYFGEESLITDYSNYTCPSGYNGAQIDAQYQLAIGEEMDISPDGVVFSRIYEFLKPQSSTNINGNTYGINHNYSAYNKNILNSKNMIYNYIKNSIDSGYPVILHAHSSVFNYYGSGGRHYICLLGYIVTSEYDFEENMNKVNYIVRDCNNNDDRFGEHVVTGDEIKNMLNYDITPLRTVICKTYN